MTSQDVYNKLKFFYSYTRVMMGAKNLMTFDMMVSMPHGTLRHRMRDLEILTLRIYEYLCDSSIAEKIGLCEEDIEKNPDNWSQWDKANLNEMKKIHLYYSALPIELYSKLMRIQSAGRHVQAQLLKDNSKSAIDEHLSNTTATLREVAKRKADIFGLDDAYQGMLRDYVDDYSTADLNSFHENLEACLNDILSASPTIDMHDSETKDRPLSKKDMMQLGAMLLKKMGFDFNIGRLIVTEYQPYCAGTPTDARILVRCSDPPSFFITLSDLLYQGSRGIYMQHIPEAWADQPVGSLKCLPSVEACSILFDDLIGTSRPFFDYLEKEIKYLPSVPTDGSFSAENLYAIKQKLTNSQKPGGATRNLKTLKMNILISRIEQELIKGDLEIKDLEERWNADITENFGKTIADKLHYSSITDWFTGSFGSKASQNISYMMALQIHDSLRSEMPDLQTIVSEGRFEEIHAWLNKNLYSKAHSLGFEELLNNVSQQKELKTDILKRYFIDQDKKAHNQHA